MVILSFSCEFFAAEGSDRCGIEVLPNSTQLACCWKERGFNQQDIDPLGQIESALICPGLLK